MLILGGKGVSNQTNNPPYTYILLRHYKPNIQTPQKRRKQCSTSTYYIRFNSDGSVAVSPIKINSEKLKELDNSLMLFYTGITRDASSVLTDSKDNMESHREYVDLLRGLAKDIESALKKGDLMRFGELLHKGWTYKKKTGNVTNAQIDDQSI